MKGQHVRKVADLQQDRGLQQMEQDQGPSMFSGNPIERIVSFSRHKSGTEIPCIFLSAHRGKVVERTTVSTSTDSVCEATNSATSCRAVTKTSQNLRQDINTGIHTCFDRQCSNQRAPP